MDLFQLNNFILNNTNVAVTAGDAFGKGGEKCVRMSFATSMENLEKAVSEIKKIFI